MEKDKIRKINLISKAGGMSMVFAKRSSHLNSSQGSRLRSDDRRILAKPSSLSRNHKEHLRIHLEKEEQLHSNQSSKLDSKVENTPNKMAENESRLAALKRNRSLDFKLKLPNIEYAENSVELDGDTISNAKKKVCFELNTSDLKDRPLGRLFNGFEITNVSKDLAFNDSPYSQHLEGKSPRVKSKLNLFKFTQYITI